MPNNNFISSQLPAALTTDIVNRFQLIMSLLAPYGQNLSPEERQRYGSINEQNKLLVGKIRDYRMQQPVLSSPDVDWNLFEQHWNSRNGFSQIEALCLSILEVCSDPRILHDYYLYQNALTDYDYSKYRAESTMGSGAFTTKVTEVRQFFPNTGGGKSASKGETTPDIGPTEV